jgi:hypothetical protein
MLIERGEASTSRGVGIHKALVIFLQQIEVGSKLRIMIAELEN